MAAALKLRAEDALDPLPRLPHGESSWPSFLTRIETSVFNPVIAASDRHCLFVDAQGRLLSCGVNSHQRTGLGHAETASLRVPVPSHVPSAAGLRVRAVAAGALHSLLVTHDGAVFSWGCSKHGALGQGAVERQVEPRRVTLAAFAVGVAASPSAHGRFGLELSHSLALTDEGDVYSWGAGRDARLGHGDSDDQWLPKRVELLRRACITSVAAGAPPPTLWTPTPGPLSSWHS